MSQTAEASMPVERVGRSDHRRRRFHSVAVDGGFVPGGLYFHYAHLAVLQNILGGISAAAAGLMMATGFRLLMVHGRRAALLFAELAFLGMALTKLPLLVVLLGLAPISVAVAALAGARRTRAA
jgi:hypothetical protein